jgi:hypothetical protein
MKKRGRGSNYEMTPVPFPRSERNGKHRVTEDTEKGGKGLLSLICGSCDRLASRRQGRQSEFELEIKSP